MKPRSPSQDHLEEITRLSAKSKLGSEQQIEPPTHFDQNKIIEHYRRMKEIQHQTLATINMSEDLKRKLFGFSEGYYLTNLAESERLVVQNHPLKGRIIMSRDKYEHYLLIKHKEKDTKINERPDNSISKVFSDSKAKLSSDISPIHPREFNSKDPSRKESMQQSHQILHLNKPQQL